jgi:hypothetical protein
MSTICKLNPNIREARRRRCALVAELMRAPDNTGRLQTLGRLLNRLRHVPHLAGWQKDRAFKRVMLQVKANGLLLA